MGRSKGNVVTGMPVLSQDDMGEDRLIPKSVDERDNLTAVFSGKRASFAKVVLHVHNDENFLHLPYLNTINYLYIPPSFLAKKAYIKYDKF